MNRQLQCILVIVTLLLLSTASAIAGGAPKLQIYSFTIRNNTKYMVDLKTGNNYKKHILTAYPNDSYSGQDTRDPGMLYIGIRKNIQSPKEEVICTKKWPAKKTSVHIRVDSDYQCTFEFKKD